MSIARVKIYMPLFDHLASVWFGMALLYTHTELGFRIISLDLTDDEWTSLTAWRHQAITRTNVDPELRRHIALLGHIVLNWTPILHMEMDRALSSPSQRPVTRSLGVFFDLRLDNRLSKHWWGWWFKTPSRAIWRHCNGITIRCRKYDGRSLWASNSKDGGLREPTMYYTLSIKSQEIPPTILKKCHLTKEN